MAWLDRRAAAVSNGVLAAYLVVALTAMLRQAQPGRRWQQTICLLGAERLPGDVLDRLCDAAEISGAGLVLGYRSIPAHVRERLGRGDAAVGFMRLGNADDARLAAEQIGTEHRFLVSQLTDTVGTSLTDTIGVSYTSTAGTCGFCHRLGLANPHYWPQPRAQPTGRASPVRGLHRVCKPGHELLGRSLRFPVDHRRDQHRDLLGLEHVACHGGHRFGGQDSAAFARVSGRAA